MTTNKHHFIISTNETIQQNKSNQQPYTIGDRVQCSNSMVGICRFIGTIQAKPGLWVGIDLSNQEDQPINPWHGKGKNSGSVNGVVYFQCPPLCGIFFPPSKVSLLPIEPSSTSSLRIPQAQPNLESIQPSSASFCSSSNPTVSSSSTSPSLHSQSDLPTNNPKTNSISSTSSTPRPKTRPSLPAAREPTFLARKPSLPLISHSSSTITPTKKQPLIRKPSNLKSTNPSRPPFAPFDPLTLQLTSSVSRNQQASNSPHPLPNKVGKNPLSNSTSQIKRSSFHHPPARPSSRASHKRAESVNSHYSRTDPPQWAQASHAQRPKSRLSLAATPELRPPPNPSPPPNSHLIDLSVLQTNNAQLQAKILTLQDEAEQNQLRAMEEDEKHLQKCSKLKLELERTNESLNQHEKNRLVELEKTRRELSQQSQSELNSLREEVSALKQSLQSTQQSFSEKSSSFDRERTELQNQLHQLRSAGQSLCGVYENKISNLEELRLGQLHQSQLIAEELKVTKLALEELQEKVRLNSTDSSTDTSASANLAKEAIEIDNERLKADLKHAEERLSKVQDEAYQLKQELETERELYEQQSQLREENLQRHTLSLKEAKDENSKLENQKTSLEFRLGQVEARLKDTLETMEQERVELEGLRAEALVSSQHTHPSKSLQSAEEENNATATIANTATGESVSSEPVTSNLSLNFRQSQLESELKQKQSKIELLESELGRHSSLRVQVDPNHMNSNPIMDQEKMLVIQKYQRLLLIKDEENLKLMQRIEELEDELDSSSKPRSGLSPSRGLLFQQFQPSPKLKHHASTQSLRATQSFHYSPRMTPMSSPSPNKSSEEIDRVTQQLVGLKLIARQSNEERAKCEKDNQMLKEVIEGLKHNNRILEHKVVQLVEAGSSNDQTIQNVMSDATQQHRSRSLTELGIEIENALGENGNNLNELSGHRQNSQRGEVIIGDYKRVQQLEGEIDQLKDKLVNLEQKHSRQVDALQNEVLELESIVEAKVFLEANLEGEIEELKQVIDATKQARIHASTPRVGGGSLQNNSKHLRRQTVSPDYQSQATSPNQTITSSTQSTSSRKASSFEYQRNGVSGPYRSEEGAHLRETSLNCLQEEEEESDEDKRFPSLEQQNRFSKVFGVSSSLYHHHQDDTSPAADSRTRIIVTNNDDHSPIPRRSKRSKSQSKQRHTIANSPSSRSPIPPPPLPSHSENNHPPPPPSSERCELCDGLDHQLATCPIFFGKA